MSRRTLSLVCPHCFCRLQLQDRGIVGKRSDCPQCHEIFYLSPHPDRGVVGLLQGKHSASALLIHGVLSLDRSSIEAAKKPASATAERSRETPAPPTKSEALLRSAATAQKESEAKESANSKPRDAVKPAAIDTKDATSQNPGSHAARATRPTLLQAVVQKAVTTPTAQVKGLAANSESLRSASPPHEWLQNRRVILSAGISTVAVAVGAFVWFGAFPAKDNSTVRNVATGSPRVAGTEEDTTSSAPAKSAPEENLTRRAKGADDSVVVADAEIPADGGNAPAVERDIPPEPVFVAHEPAVAEIPDLQAALPLAVKVDIEQRLSQPIKKFEQVRAVPVRELLELLEELLGVPVVADRKALGELASGLDRPVSLRLNSTTVGGILSAVLNAAGLEWEIDGQSIQIVRPASTDPAVSP